MASVRAQEGIRRAGLGLLLPEKRNEMELEEGEIHTLQKVDRIFDPDTDLSYIGVKVEALLGHFRKDFEGLVSAETLGSKFGGYGSFLPAYRRSHVSSQARSPPRPRTVDPPCPTEASELKEKNDTSTEPSRAPHAKSEGCNTLKAPSVVESSKQDICCEQRIENKSSNTDDHKNLRVRIKVASDNTLNNEAAEICHSLGLDSSPSSSMDNNDENERLSSHEPDDHTNKLPPSILQEKHVISIVPLNAPHTKPECFNSFKAPSESSKHVCHEQTGKNKSSNQDDQKNLRVRIKVGPDNIPSNKTEEIFHCLGLDASPSSSMDGSEHEKTRLTTHGLRDDSDPSPSSILQWMTPFPVEGEMLLSPLHDDLLDLPVRAKMTPAVGSKPLEVKSNPPACRGIRPVANDPNKEKKEKHPFLSESEDGDDRMADDKYAFKCKMSIGTEKLPPLSNSSFSMGRKEDTTDLFLGISRQAMQSEPMYAGDTEKTERPIRKVSDAKSEKNQQKFKVSSQAINTVCPRNDIGSKARQNFKDASVNSSSLTGRGVRETSPNVKVGQKISPFTVGKSNNSSSKNAKITEFKESLIKSPKSSQNQQKGLDVVKKHIPKPMQQLLQKYVHESVNDPIGCTDATTVRDTLPNCDTPAASVAPSVIEEHWVCCDKCQKWRLLPHDIMPKDLPEVWICSMLNWLPGMNRCDISEEETTEALHACYQVPVPDCQTTTSCIGAVESTAALAHMQHSKRKHIEVGKSNIMNRDACAQLGDQKKKFMDVGSHKQERKEKNMMAAESLLDRGNSKIKLKNKMQADEDHSRLPKKAKLERRIEDGHEGSSYCNGSYTKASTSRVPSVPTFKKGSKPYSSKNVGKGRRSQDAEKQSKVEVMKPKNSNTKFIRADDNPPCVKKRKASDFGHNRPSLDSLGHGRGSTKAELDETERARAKRVKLLKTGRTESRDGETNGRINDKICSSRYREGEDRSRGKSPWRP